MASGAVGVVAVFNATTTEAPLGATEEASRTEGEAAVEEAATEEVSRLAQFSSLLVPWSAVGFVTGHSVSRSAGEGSLAAALD